MEENLKDKTARGLFWGGMSNGVMQLLNLAFGIMLGRLLTPADYGMVGMLQVFSLVAIALQESGLNIALINKKDLRHEDVNAVFWFSLSVSVALYLILFICAPLIAAFYHQPSLTPLARYSFLAFVISSLGICHNAILMRELKVKQNAIIMMSSLVVSGTVGVIMAWKGMAYWGLATQNIVYIAGVAAGRWMVSGWKPTLFSRSSSLLAPRDILSPLKSLLPFSLKIMASNLITILNNNILTVLLGRFFNEREVGYYNQAAKWNLMGYSIIQGMIVSVAQPVMRQVEDDRERLVRVFRKMLRFASFVSFPCMFGLALTAPEIITIAITEKWLRSAQLMQIVCIGGAFLPLQQLMYQLLVSKGRSDVCLKNTIAFGIVQVIAVIACRSWGITAMVCAFVGVNIAWVLVWWGLVWQQTRLSLWLFLRDLLPFLFIAAACILAAAWAASFITNIYLSLFIKVIVAASLYLIAMQLLHVETFREALAYLRKKKT